MAVLKYKENDKWKQVGYNVLNGRLDIKPVQEIPVGSIIAFSDNLLHDGYLKCDGSNYLKKDYPDLANCATVTNVDNEHFKVPDLRELVLVGSGHNDTQNIAVHDEYNIGQFKDDQFQEHAHNLEHKYCNDGAGGYGGRIGNGISANATTISAINIVSQPGKQQPRVGSTTHGKQYGVVYYIKAVPTYNINVNNVDISRAMSGLNLGNERVIGKLDNDNIYERYIKIYTPTQSNADVKVADFICNDIIELNMTIKRNDGIQIGTFSCNENNDEAYIFYKENGLYVHCGTPELNATAIVKVRYTK